MSIASISNEFAANLSDAYEDTPLGAPIPPITIASTGDGLGGNGQMLGDNLAVVGGGLNAGEAICFKCLSFWIAIAAAFGLLVLYRDRIIR